MAIFTWSDRFAVKVEEFDGHHKKLMGLVNSLHENMMLGKGRSVLEPILAELKEYTKYHFAAEEMKMAKYAYPYLFEHKAQHKELLLKLEDFYHAYTNGETEITIDLFIFLKDWLLRHIGKEDNEYGAFFNEKGVF
jgi:hemerythrin